MIATFGSNNIRIRPLANKEVVSIKPSVFIPLLLQCAFLQNSIQPAIAADQAIVDEVTAAKKHYESFMIQHDDGKQHDEQYVKVLNAQKRLMRLLVKNAYILPCSVYTGNKLTDGWRLNADDTIHTNEGSERLIPLVCARGQTIKIVPAWKWSELSSCDFYLGHSGDRHQNGYKNVVRLKREADELFLPVSIPKGSDLLFVIVRTKRDGYFKFVFLVQVN